MKGKIIRGVAGFYVVESAGKRCMCRARGLFRRKGIKPLVGDLIRAEEAVTEESEASIVEIFPRKNVLLRPAVSNIDQALVVLALRSPEPRLYLLDEYLLTMEKQNIPAAVLWNKTDLNEGNLLERYTEIYRRAGYRVLSLSTRTGEGMEELWAFLRGKTTVLAGPSGVGKSSLTNLLCPEVSMEVGEISRKISRGKQTTRHTELFPLGEESYLLDTPGFTSVRVETDEEELRTLFPELLLREGQCRFTGCRHLSEPDCAVKEAVAGGLIPPSRYESYQKLMRELSERRKYG